MDTFVFAVNPAGVWHHSTFPHPLVTIDYDAQDKPIQVCISGPIAQRLQERVEAVVAEICQ